MKLNLVASRALNRRAVKRQAERQISVGLWRVALQECGTPGSHGAGRDDRSGSARKAAQCIGERLTPLIRCYPIGCSGKECWMDWISRPYNRRRLCFLWILNLDKVRPIK